MADEIVVSNDPRPFDIQLGYDTQRIWATGVQFFANPDHVVMVFREQTAAAGKGGETQTYIRNVGSVVMPIATAREMHRVLGHVLSGDPDAQE